ncbi:MAG: sensor histidine kinase [Thermoguttaceae bacterium]
MFLRDRAIHSDTAETPDVSPFVESTFESFLCANTFCAGFLCAWNANKNSGGVVSACGIPAAPFRGAKQDSLDELIQECLRYHPEPHVHSIPSRSRQWADIASFVDTNAWQHRFVFIPAYARDLDFVFLCFAENGTEVDISPDLIAASSDCVNTVSFLLSASSLQKHLRTMEVYVREIGHDIASSVQAIVSKLRNVSRGLLTGPAALAKVQEAEAEILSAYRVADTLGITVDPDYNLSNGAEFDAVSAVFDVLALCRSEAEERHIELRTDFQHATMRMWGDEKAIQSAVMQLLINGIKYAKGSTYVSVRVSAAKGCIEFSVIDRGKPLDDDEKLHMWDFGWRGEKAKELHVNGSGIGLYTVRKIAAAHGGGIGARTYGDVVTVFFSVPCGDVLKKSALLSGVRPPCAS